MANRKLTMRKIKEILRLKWALKLSDRQTGQSVNIAHSTVGEYLKRAERAGLDWETVKTLGEDELNSKLFPPVLKNKSDRPQPDWKEVEKDMQGKHVTLMLLWKAYIDQHPEGYGYSHFCQKYRRWQKVTAKPVMRIPKKIGEEVQVDYSGQTMKYTDPSTREVQKVQIFVGVLGASGLIYAEAHKSQAIPNWIRAHVRMFEFFGGVSKLIRPDNLKSGVTTPRRV
jgi:transposase